MTAQEDVTAGALVEVGLAVVEAAIVVVQEVEVEGLPVQVLRDHKHHGSQNGQHGFHVRLEC